MNHGTDLCLTRGGFYENRGRSPVSVHLDAASVEAVARRVVELLDMRERLAGARWGDAHAVAAIVGRSAEWVRDHARELGGKPVGNGPRPRWTFDLEAARERGATLSSSKGSQAATPGATGLRRRRRPPVRRSAQPVPENDPDRSARGVPDGTGNVPRKRNTGVEVECGVLGGAERGGPS
jgi:hypothetical protein